MCRNFGIFHSWCSYGVHREIKSTDFIKYFKSLTNTKKLYVKVLFFTTKNNFLVYKSFHIISVRKFSNNDEKLLRLIWKTRNPKCRTLVYEKVAAPEEKLLNRKIWRNIDVTRSITGRIKIRYLHLNFLDKLWLNLNRKKVSGVGSKKN